MISRPAFVQTRVPAELWERIKRHSDRAGLSATQVAVRLLVEALDAIDRGDAGSSPLATYLLTLEKENPMPAHRPQDPSISHEPVMEKLIRKKARAKASAEKANAS